MSDSNDNLRYQKHFYGRRRGRPLRSFKQRLMKQKLRDFELQIPTDGFLDLSSLYPESVHAYALEIGFGGGEHLATLAESHPDRGFIGCEAFENGVASLLQHLEEKGVKENVKIYPNDVRSFLKVLPSERFQFVYLLFPDPWPKKKHHKRRLMDAAFLSELHRLMMLGGEFRVATDDPSYQTWIEERLEENSHLFKRESLLSSTEGTKSEDWPQTRYEQKALKSGRSCLYWILKRV